MTIIDRFDAFFRVVLHAIDFATNRVCLHEALIVGPHEGSPPAADSGLRPELNSSILCGAGDMAWLRRLIVSVGVGGASYALMLGIMVLSVVYDREFEPVITFAFDTGRGIIDTLDRLVAGSYWGQVAANHLRERVNMTHVVLSLPAIIMAVMFVGIPLNWILGGTRTALQRIAIAIISVPATVVLAVALFTFNALVPETYAALLRFADWIWQGSLNALSAWGDTIPGARKLTNVARQGFSGHHFVIMALCSMIAAFLVNALFALATSAQPTKPGAHDF